MGSYQDNVPWLSKYDKYFITIIDDYDSSTVESNGRLGWEIDRVTSKQWQMSLDTSLAGLHSFTDIDSVRSDGCATIFVDLQIWILTINMWFL